jgi:2-C-methyl-D-erythritol 2,4-cyclodiphosphate synthase
MMKIRIGQGVDIHQLKQGIPLYIGGIIIPSKLGSLGHSDADVLLHAIIDAIFGAAGLRDIGVHFPDTDMNYKGIRSTLLLKECHRIISQEQWQIGNIDATVLLQSPKISKYIPAMEEEIAKILEIDSSQVNIKATTTEKLGFVGRGEGIQAEAVVLLTMRE